MKKDLILSFPCPSRSFSAEGILGNMKKLLLIRNLSTLVRKRGVTPGGGGMAEDPTIGTVDAGGGLHTGPVLI